MSRKLLEQYIQQLRSGDSSNNEKFIRLLGGRLVQVPVASESKDGSRGATKIEVLRIQHAGKTSALAFTSKPLLDQWSETHQHDRMQSLSLLSADLCLALSSDTSLLLNPGTSLEFVLEPEAVKQIANLPYLDEEEDSSSGGPTESSIPNILLEEEPLDDIAIQVPVEKDPLESVDVESTELSRHKNIGEGRIKVKTDLRLNTWQDVNPGENGSEERERKDTVQVDRNSVSSKDIDDKY